jgi:hypothetical protein
MARIFLLAGDFALCPGEGQRFCELGVCNLLVPHKGQRPFRSRKLSPAANSVAAEPVGESLLTKPIGLAFRSGRFPKLPYRI